MCQLCVRSGFWGLWKQFQLSQVRQSRCLVFVGGRVTGVDVRCGFVSVPLLLLFLLSSPPTALTGALSLTVVSSPGLRWWCWCCALPRTFVYMSLSCVLCVMGICSVCRPTLLQIYNRVCGPWECLSAENVQGSPSIEDHFCHSRWDLNTKAEPTLPVPISIISPAKADVWEPLY